MKLVPQSKRFARTSVQWHPLGMRNQRNWLWLQFNRRPIIFPFHISVNRAPDTSWHLEYSNACNALFKTVGTHSELSELVKNNRTKTELRLIRSASINQNGSTNEMRHREIHSLSHVNDNIAWISNEYGGDRLQCIECLIKLIRNRIHQKCFIQNGIWCENVWNSICVAHSICILMRFGANDGHAWANFVLCDELHLAIRRCN